MAGEVGRSHAEKRNSQDLWNLGLTERPAKPGPVIGNSIGQAAAGGGITSAPAELLTRHREAVCKVLIAGYGTPS